MSFLELAKTRYSARKFSEKKVETEKINTILETGRIAPTAKNLQPQRIYVLQSEEAIKKMQNITVCAFNAPLIMLVCADKNEAWVNPNNNRSSAEMDASIVALHMMLQAKDIGIDSVWVCFFDTEKVKKEYNLPDNIEPYCIIPMGYASNDTVPSPRHNERKPLNATVTWL